MNKIELEIISIFVRLADLLNLPKTVGEIYGLLFIAEEPMCLDDLMKKLKISKGSTSQGLKILRSFGALKKIYIHGDRKDYYLAEDSLRKIANGFANEQIKPHLESGSERLEYLRELINNDDKINKKFVKDKIKKLENWEKKVNMFLPLALKLIGDKND